MQVVLKTRNKKKTFLTNRKRRNAQQISMKDVQHLVPPPTKQIKRIPEFSLVSNHIKPQEYLKRLLAICQKQQSQRKFLQNQCYLGIGKKLVTYKSNEKSVEIEKVNFYIRDYMLSNAQSHVQQLQQCNQKIAYLVPYIKGVCFSPDCFPKLLQEYLSEGQFHQIVENINFIIQNRFYLYKKQNSNKIHNRIPRFLFPMFFIILVLLILPAMGIHHEIMAILTGVFVGFCFLVVLILAVKAFLQQKQDYCLTQQIVKQLKIYAQTLNMNKEKGLKWVIGKDFFWIQVHVLKSNQSKSQLSQKEVQPIKQMQNESNQNYL